MLRAALFASIADAACDNGIDCRAVEVNGMSFQCAFAGQDGAKSPVLMLHGNDDPNKERFFELMRFLAPLGHPCVACDQRGYTPGASPMVYEAYNYDELIKDLFGFADAAGMDRFHMVAHDQGARVTWHALAAGQGRQRFLSFSSLAIPHADAFSDLIYGPLADLRQQTASQYVTVFTLNKTESTATACKLLHRSHSTDVDFCQRRFWWYNGATDSGNMAQAPIQSLEELIANNNTETVELRKLFPHAKEEYGDAGVPQRTKVGKVNLPVMYACGRGDGHDLCGHEYAFANLSKSYSDASRFTYLELPDCGHNIMPCSKWSSAICEGTVCGSLDGGVNKIFSAIHANIELAEGRAALATLV